MAKRTPEEILAQREAWLSRKTARESGQDIPMQPPSLGISRQGKGKKLSISKQQMRLETMLRQNLRPLLLIQHLHLQSAFPLLLQERPYPPRRLPFHGQIPTVIR